MEVGKQGAGLRKECFSVKKKRHNLGRPTEEKKIKGEKKSRGKKPSTGAGG